MPLIFVLRALFSLLSLFLIGLAAYLLWTWYFGIEAVRPDGLVEIVHEPTRLWWGLGLALWSIGGGGIVFRLLLGGKGRPFNSQRGEGQMIEGAQGAKLWVELAGNPNGQTLLLTHGWGLDSSLWQYAKEDLGGEFRLVLWDLPGLGRSKGCDGKLTLESLALNLDVVRQWAGGTAPVLVGHSIGGMDIQTLARDNRAAFRDVAGVVLVNTTHTNPLRTMILPRLMQALRYPVLEPAMYLTKWLLPLSWLSAWQSYLSGTAHLANRLGFGKHVSKQQLEWAALVTTRNSPAVQASGNLAMFEWDATNGLASFPVPVLAIAGDMDIVTKAEASRTIEGLAPVATLEVVNDVNHMGLLEAPERYNALIARFSASRRTTPVAASATTFVTQR